MIKYFVGLSLLLGLVISSCSKSTIVGSDILKDDFVNVSYIDSSTLRVLNLKDDSIRIYPLSSGYFLLGSIDDPVFGKTTSEMYVQVRKLFDLPNMENVVLDSVVLSLNINPAGLWGDSLAEQSIEVYELGESINDYDSIYTNQKFEKGMLLATSSYVPFDSDTSYVIYGTDTLNQNNTYRIPLDLSFGEKLLSDTTSLNNDTLITNLTNGLLLKAQSSSNSVFGISSAIFLDDYSNKIILYYTKDDTLQLSYPLTLGGKRGVYYEHDHEAAMVSSFFNNPVASDSLLFLAGMQNCNISIEIPYLNELEDKLINFAELEFYTVNLDEKVPGDIVQQFYLYNLQDDGSLKYVDDLSIAITSGNINYFNGFPVEESQENGLILKKYNFNITNELKKRIEEGNTETKMILKPYLSQAKANRSVLYGPGNSEFAAKLKITYTTE